MNVIIEIVQIALVIDEYKQISERYNLGIYLVDFV